MSFVDSCVKFLEDLILGDFNEEQMVSAQIVGGLISLIPVVDQVMDVRDVSGCLFRIHKHGGFAKATLDQKINLGFAAFGVIPEVGSAFKTVFKPLYRERKAVKGVFNGGVAMIERMLGAKKGGAVRWVRALDWAGNTRAAIAQANLALNSCIEMLEYIAAGHWWCPGRVEQLARDALPGMRAMRGRLDAPIREAAAEIRRFLEEMLGEHAAAVVMAVAGNAATLPRGTSSRGHGGTTSSRLSNHGHGGTPTTNRRHHDDHQQVQGAQRTAGRTTGTRVANAAQRLAYEAYAGLNFAVKGLLGEHIADFHVIEDKREFGLHWTRHDMVGGPGAAPGGWRGAPRKINDDETPMFLCVPATRVLSNGIDSAWLTARSRPQEFAIVEAKANFNPAAALHTMLGEARDGPRPAQGGGGLKRPRAAAAPAGSGPQPGMVMQMSHPWIQKRLSEGEYLAYRGRMYTTGGALNYTRHVLLVTPIQAAEHIVAVEKIMAEGLVNRPAEAQRHAAEHAQHAVAREFGEAALIEAENHYNTHGRTPRAPRKRKPPPP